MPNVCVHPFRCWVAAYTAQRAVLQPSAALRSAQHCTAPRAISGLPYAPREQQNNQCYNDLKRYRRCARAALYSPPRNFWVAVHKIIQPPLPAQHCTQHCTVITQCPARRGSTARRVAQENALHVPCDHTARSIAQCFVLHCIANIVQRSVLAAVIPSQVKRSRQ